MFIYIKHGDGQHFLANPNCSLIIFRNYLEEKLNIQHPGSKYKPFVSADTVDLYDDQMNMKLLFRMKDPNENLENLFEPRGTYYACKIERNEADNSFKSIVPLEINANAELLGQAQGTRLTDATLETLVVHVGRKVNSPSPGLKDQKQCQKRSSDVTGLVKLPHHLMHGPSQRLIIRLGRRRCLFPTSPPSASELG
ncbi:uncharacterized protein CXorf65 homolog [Carcharodon carcharias]|uniref:uncharacterized protein CXorf65 homolog n=1 Tax=Carcharodon carcharias TaxID=13397 RepID=UPI001B7EC378|nr:uncharacterized protein CXorf65 homolog [Carcharodon carcharias]